MMTPDLEFAGPAAEPAWLDRTEYPFAPHYLQVDEGRMHYVDEGQGPPVVFCHGNPTWSFMWRHLIRALAPRFRCVAPDFLGFGLSDKPTGWSYLPQDHAAYLEQLIDALDLRDLTLVVHDWGGPIGLSYALRHPERVARLVVLNTWLWSRDDLRTQLFSRVAGSLPGRWAIEQFDLFARLVMPAVYARPSRLTPDVHRHYTAPTQGPGDRRGHGLFARQLTHARDWLGRLWSQRHRLAGKPSLLLWGLRDPAFGPDLSRWEACLPEAIVYRFDDVGHYVAEEAGEALVGPVLRFLDADG